ncbi:MAG: hypothetical protein M3O46_19110, partial [Myxococcota bacterium]|nr:hypothetical protein [Myxococcota bacterium]
MVERRAKEADELVAEKNGKRADVAPADGATPTSAKNDPPIDGNQDDKPQATSPSPANGPWRNYKDVVADLAGRIVDAQRPIRVLQALRWDDSVEEQFLRGKQRDMPKVDAAYYERVDLGFDPREKLREFTQ